MALACQRDSYLKQLKTKVSSCEASKIKISGKAIEGYNVILEDTVLFPEGGGQPDDRGTINNLQVLRVTRKGTEAIHFVTEPLVPGQEVHLEVDWERRYDHMQQHSGQHLISAIAENEFNTLTTSWNLGERLSSIELDDPNFTSDKMKKLEEIVNSKIKACIPVTVKYYEEDSPDLKDAHTRGLPADYKGPVRVIIIDGVDRNMCCGTHVCNLSDIQVIKLFYVEKGNKKKTNLYFVAGNRVLNYLSDCITRERAFNSYLKCGPDQHVEMLDKLQKTLKLSSKNELNLVRDLALLEAQKFKSLQPRPSFLSLHRKEGNADFMSIIVNEINDENVLLFLSIGDDRGAGQITLAGKPDLVADLGPKICQLLGGKGTAKGNRFQGKVTNLNKRSAAEVLLKQAMDETPIESYCN